MQSKVALLIDPAHEIRGQLSQILPFPEWSIEEALDNAVAFDLVKSKKFDLILTSGNTSGKEDVELLRNIRRLHRHTRMIILADEGTPADVLNAMRERAFSYFSWPFPLAALADMVKHAIDAPNWDDGIEIVSSAPSGVRLLARCDPMTADRLLQFTEEMIDLPEDEKNVVGTALRELLMNAIEYGGHFDPGQFVELSYIRTKRAVACRVKDPGEGFSFDEISHAAVMNPEGDPLRHLNYREQLQLRPGGFGVLLARNSVDELIYNDQGNEVLLIKYVDTSSASTQAAGHV
jgi:anti-sigma regulatory factor (Ser/Thr protein kinase)/CheY-like chemotaxis protein